MGCSSSNTKDSRNKHDSKDYEHYKLVNDIDEQLFSALGVNYDNTCIDITREADVTLAISDVIEACPTYKDKENLVRDAIQYRAARFRLNKEDIMLGKINNTIGKNLAKMFYNTLDETKDLIIKRWELNTDNLNVLFLNIKDLIGHEGHRKFLVKYVLNILLYSKDEFSDKNTYVFYDEKSTNSILEDSNFTNQIAKLLKSSTTIINLFYGISDIENFDNVLPIFEGASQNRYIKNFSFIRFSEEKTKGIVSKSNAIKIASCISVSQWHSLGIANLLIQETSARKKFYDAIANHLFLNFVGLQILNSSNDEIIDSLSYSKKIKVLMIGGEETKTSKEYFNIIKNKGNKVLEGFTLDYVTFS